MRKFLWMIFLFGLAVPAFSDSVTVMGGYVVPRGKSDIFDQNERETTFKVKDLNGFGASISYDHFIGEYFNIGGGITAYDNDTRVTDTEFQFNDGTPIRRRISLEIVPIELNLHFLPIGREQAVIPYLGGGVGAYYWQYEEKGDFVINRNSPNPDVLTGRAFSEGTDAGWHVEGGVQIPFSRSLAFSAEAKYWKAHGDLDRNSFDPGFEPIDLSATMYSAGVSIWF